ncbi:MAG: EAL domain-containing protein [Methylacidiphilales bacterium]|nr:EAL domain-containing protein [Candidatus Methylacidiphilales bacterium]
MTRPVLSRFSVRSIWAAAAAFLLASLVAVGLATWQFRVDDIEDSAAHVRNLAVVLSGQVERSIEAIDITLVDFLEFVALAGVQDQRGLANIVTSDRFQNLLRERVERLPQAYGAAVHGANGRVLATTFPDTNLAVDISDRDYFREMQSGALDGLFISQPLSNRVTGVSNIVLARRINTVSGEFAGVVLITIAVSYFENAYAPLESFGDLRLTLFRRNGTVLLRYPDESKVTIDTTLPSSSPWYDLVAKGGGEFRSPGYFDGVARWFAVRPLQAYPLVLNVGISEHEMLARWYQRAVGIAIGTVMLLSAAALLLWAVLHQIQRLRRSEGRLRDKSRALAMSNMRFDAALNNISQGLCMFDAGERIVVSNARFAEIYRLLPAEAAPGTALAEVFGSRIRSGTYAGEPPSNHLADIANSPAEVQFLPDGRVIHVRCNRMGDGGWMTVHEDITDRHRSESQIAYMARHDLLTGLFNRAAFSEKIEEAGARLRRFGETFTILLLDLDRFKQVNDTLGHLAGDMLLKQAAERLRAALRETDVLARFGGDEFAIIQVGVDSQREAAIAFSERLIACLSAPYDLGGQEVTVSVSIGIALAPEHGVEADKLIRNADLAMYRVKGEGRNGYSVYDDGLMEVADARQRLDSELRHAIANDEFELHYQAIVDARTRRICGAEALVRWRHPRRGLVPPLDFIPFAEESGLIEQIGRWVLHRACIEAATWPDDTVVAVNLSPAQFRRADPIGMIRQALADSGLPARRLEIEITENVFLTGAEDNIALVRQMKELGVSIALDDFGTGYSSLSYLTTFPFDKVKIDRSFTMNMTKRADCAAVIASVITLTRCLGVATTAEGVENRAQFELLRGAGIDYCQGYLFGRPAPAGALDFTRPADPEQAGAAA